MQQPPLHSFLKKVQDLMNLCSRVVYYFTGSAACRWVRCHNHSLAYKRTGTDAKYVTQAKNISYMTNVRFVATTVTINYMQ